MRKTGLIVPVLMLAIACGDDTNHNTGGAAASGGTSPGGSAPGGSAPGGGGQGGDGQGGDTPTSFTVSIEVSGLITGGLAVTLNGSETLTVDADGVHTFATALDDGASYDVGAVSPRGEGCVVTAGTGSVSGDDVSDVTVTCAPVVTAVYDSAPGWNDYLVSDGSATCDVSAFPTACVHAGERRFVYVPDATDCTDVVASDDLDAFTWVCDDSSLPVRVVSHLSDTTPLSALLDTATPAWLANAVSIEVAGTEVVHTVADVWWPNPVLPAEGGVQLTTASAIYVAASDPAERIYIYAERVGLVTAPGITLTSTTDSEVVLLSESDFSWVEATVDATGMNAGIRVDASRHGVIRNTRVAHGGRGLDLDRVEGARLTDIELREQTSRGLYMTSSGYSLLDGVSAWSCGAEGIFLDGAYDVHAHDVVVANNASGLRATSSEGVLVSELRAFNNAGDGVVVSGSGVRLAGVSAHHNDGIGINVAGNEHVVQNVTTASNEGNGIEAGVVANLQLVAATSQNNGGSGVAIDGAGTAALRDVVSVDNTTGIALRSCTVRIEGALRFGGNDNDCANTNATGLSSACVADNVAATVTLGVNADFVFAGAYSSDSVNTSEAGGLAALATLSDWVHFQSPHRGWGVNGAFPGSASTGACGSGDTCRIWGFQVRVGDAVARNIADGAPTGADHELSDGEAFLLHAVELMYDGVGDDDLLCETDEACLVTPNAARYQGQGALVSVPFTPGGALSGITLWQYDINGVVIL